MITLFILFASMVVVGAVLGVAALFQLLLLAFKFVLVSVSLLLSLGWWVLALAGLVVFALVKGFALLVLVGAVVLAFLAVRRLLRGRPATGRVRAEDPLGRVRASLDRMERRVATLEAGMARRARY